MGEGWTRRGGGGELRSVDGGLDKFATVWLGGWAAGRGQWGSGATIGAEIAAAVALSLRGRCDVGGDWPTVLAATVIVSIMMVLSASTNVSTTGACRTRF